MSALACHRQLKFQSAADQATQADVADKKEGRPLFQGMAAYSFDHLLQVIVYQE
jgi:hypothetical protein